MKKSICPGDTRDTRPAETPLTDPWQAFVQKDATPGIFPILWCDGFAVGHGTQRKYNAALMLFRYNKPLEYAGKKLFWAQPSHEQVKAV